MAPRMKYNPKTNRWETQEVPVPVGTDVTAGDGQPWEWSDIPTTTMPQNKPNIPKNVPSSRGGSRQTTTQQGSPTTTVLPQSPSTTTPPTGAGKAGTNQTTLKGKGGAPKGRFEGGVRPERGKFPTAKENQPVDYTEVIKGILGDGNLGGLMNLLAGGSGGSQEKPRTVAQKVASAQKYGRENLALARKFYGDQQTQANEAIRNATTEFLNNMGQSTAYNELPLVTVPTPLQGLQQNLLAYGATGQEATAQQAQDQQAADMYTALANRGATQLGNAEKAYMDALRRAGLGGQTAGVAGVAGNVNQLQNAVMLANLQAILQAQQ